MFDFTGAQLTGRKFKYFRTFLIVELYQMFPQNYRKKRKMYSVHERVFFNEHPVVFLLSLSLVWQYGGSSTPVVTLEESR